MAQKKIHVTIYIPQELEDAINICHNSHAEYEDFTHTEMLRTLIRLGLKVIERRDARKRGELNE